MTSPDRTTAPAIHPLPVMPLPQAVRTPLAGGIEAVSIADDSQPVSRISIVWPVGQADVPDCNALALMMPMLSEGTLSMSGADIADILEFNGAWMKTDIGRHTTILTLFLLNKTAERIFPLLADILLHPAFPPDALERLREKLIAQTRLRQHKVKELARQLSNRMIFGVGAPAARITSAEGFKAVSREELVDLHKRLILSTRPTLYLAGAVNGKIEQMAMTMMDSFGSPTDKALAANVVPAPAMQTSSRCMEVVADSLQTAVRIAIPTIGPSHPDYYSLQTAVFALGGHFGSRLMSNIREDKGYTYGISAMMLTTRETSDIIIHCETDNRFTDSVLNETEVEIARLASRPMGDDELEIVRHTAHSGLLATLDSPFTVIDNYIVEQAVGIPAASGFIRRQENVLAASAEKIQEMAEKYLLGTPRAIALAGNAGSDQAVSQEQ